MGDDTRVGTTDEGGGAKRRGCAIASHRSMTNTARDRDA
jgi:hypothetical protein